jgi:renalase
VTPRVQIAVVGAGPAGLMAARSMHAAGASVVVFDKGRRPGGRANTREHDTYRFDHGAQFFTVRDPRIHSFLHTWIERGLVAEWKGTFLHIDEEGARPARAAERYVALPGMVNLALHLSDGLDVRTGIRIEAVHREGGFWHLCDADGIEQGVFDRVVVAVPAPQAAPLLSAAPRLQAITERVVMDPCWAGMLVFASPPPLPFDGAFIEDPVLAWVAHDSGKPGRPASRSWVLHATREWTREHDSMNRSDVPAALAGALERRFGTLPEVIFSRAHRWGFAQAASEPVGMLHDAASHIGVCGDWCRGGRLEGALLSGLEIGDRMMG